MRFTIRPNFPLLASGDTAVDHYSEELVDVVKVIFAEVAVHYKRSMAPFLSGTPLGLNWKQASPLRGFPQLEALLPHGLRNIPDAKTHFVKSRTCSA